MLGAIIGDIIGSVYEWNNIKTKNFPLFRNDCHFTDDTVMTIAAASAVMEGDLSLNGFASKYKSWGRDYPGAGYGPSFRCWLRSESTEGYNSWGNGSAMRVSPCGWVTHSLEEAESLAHASAYVTHNHPEGMKGAAATASAIYLARYKASKIQIKEHIEKTYKYNLSQTLGEIRPMYSFHVSCQKTVPQAIIAFLESTDFEDAIRNAVSLGGDSDTLTAITGSIAEAVYGIPYGILKKAYRFLDDKLIDVCNRWMEFIGET